MTDVSVNELSLDDFRTKDQEYDYRPIKEMHQKSPTQFMSVPMVKKPVPLYPDKQGAQAYGHPEKEEHALGSGTTCGCSSDFVKSMLFGGLDGIITTFALIAASVGGRYDVQIILLLGISKILADATSMGVGDFISERAELDYHRSEMRREQHELKFKPNAERLEMVEIYMQKGMTEEHANIVVDILMRNDQMLDVMMVDELGIFPPDENANPLKNGVVTFCSFLAFGSVPLWLYVIFWATDYQNYNVMFGLAIVATLMTLFCLGAVNAKLTKQPIIKAGLLTMINGGLATAASYGIGVLLEQIMVPDE